MAMLPGAATTFLASLLTGTPPPACPNTTCVLPIFDPSTTPATSGSLQLEHWSPLLNFYPNLAFTQQLHGALWHGIMLGYLGPLHHHTWLEVSNLPMDPADMLHLHQEIDTRLHEGRLHLVHNPASIGFVCSPMGVVPKLHSTHLWKANLEDAFCHIIITQVDANLMGIQVNGSYYQECTLAFGGHSSPFLFNLFAEILHWITSFALQSVSHSPSTHSAVSHYLDDFFGTLSEAAAAVPIKILSLTAAALGFRLSHKKTVWNTTHLEILGVELDSVAQTTSITVQCHLCILQLCCHILDRDCASLLELQQVAGHLQFVTQVVLHGHVFLCQLYDAVKVHYKMPFPQRISRAACNELTWWTSTLVAWDGMSLLQPSPLLVEHIWTDASKRCVGGHWGPMESPRDVFSQELSCHHCQKDIQFLKTLAVLDALFLPLSIPPPPAKRGISTPPTSFVASTKLSKYATFLLWNGLAASTCSHSTAPCNAFIQFVHTTLRLQHPLPASSVALIEWAGQHHHTSKSYHSVKWSLAILKSWHINFGFSMVTFDDARLALQGYKHAVVMGLDAQEAGGSRVHMKGAQVSKI
ncbi:hypothetical protein NDA10_002017 [Ustilago hordei]|nr:hypothetical protein NDA10_002017 [Ustilago hordei]